MHDHSRANIPNTLIKALIFVSIIATGTAPPTVNLHNYNAARIIMYVDYVPHLLAITETLSVFNTF